MGASLDRTTLGPPFSMYGKQAFRTVENRHRLANAGRHVLHLRALSDFARESGQNEISSQVLVTRFAVWVFASLLYPGSVIASLEVTALKHEEKFR